MSAPVFRLLSVSIENFRGFGAPFELALDAELTLLMGENGAGKSSALNAIEWCLFGGEVTKKGSGIDERGAWEVAHRGSTGPISVALTMEALEGRVVLRRSRARDAKLRDPDRLELELPDGEVLGSDEIEDWRARNQLPDWTTWKHSFCQHQELLRIRVTDEGQRSAQLGRLLGLDAYLEASAVLKGLRHGVLQKTAQAQLADLESELTRAMERPALEVEDLTERLGALGVDRSALSESLVDKLAAKLTADAHSLAESLPERLVANEIPTANDLEALAQWSPNWLRGVKQVTRQLEDEAAELRRRQRGLEDTQASLAPAAQRLEDARAAQATCTKTHGDAAHLEEHRSRLAQERSSLEEEERVANQTLALLRQALESLERSGAACPVCDHADPQLETRLRARIAADGGAGFAAKLEALDRRDAALAQQLAELTRLQGELESAEIAYRRTVEHLRASLPDGVGEQTGALESQLAQWKRRIDRLELSARRTAEYASRFSREDETLALLGKWRIAVARTDAAAGDLTRTAAWEDLDTSIDEAAGLACDLEAVGQMIREAQSERSRERVHAVNQSLGKYFTRIAHRDEATGIHVEVKQTAARISYRLIDDTGADATPVLNQAAMNALAFALLFAQVEDRATRGLPAWVQLDDPGQSLDAEHEAGLADALLELADRVPVLVDTYPSPLSRRLVGSAPHGLREVQLGTRPLSQGARR
jgi:DNA repair exonuclease SbcCD ATPase subunit